MHLAGAPVPPGADAVVKVEDTQLVTTAEGQQKHVQINTKVQPGKDIRQVGSDIQ